MEDLETEDLELEALRRHGYTFSESDSYYDTSSSNDSDFENKYAHLCPSPLTPSELKDRAVIVRAIRASSCQTECNNEQLKSEKPEDFDNLVFNNYYIESDNVNENCVKDQPKEVIRINDKQLSNVAVFKALEEVPPPLPLNTRSALESNSNSDCLPKHTQKGNNKKVANINSSKSNTSIKNNGIFKDASNNSNLKKGVKFRNDSSINTSKNGAQISFDCKLKFNFPVTVDNFKAGATSSNANILPNRRQDKRKIKELFKAKINIDPKESFSTKTVEKLKKHDDDKQKMQQHIMETIEILSKRSNKNLEYIQSSFNSITKRKNVQSKNLKLLTNHNNEDRNYSTNTTSQEEKDTTPKSNKNLDIENKVISQKNQTTFKSNSYNTQIKIARNKRLKRTKKQLNKRVLTRDAKTLLIISVGIIFIMLILYGIYTIVRL